MKCPYCEYLETVSELLKKSNGLTDINKHWIITEGFLRMHNEKDYCDYEVKI